MSIDLESPSRAEHLPHPEKEQNPDLSNTFEVVDGELKAHITNLVSALGGVDVTLDDRPYKLGDDALACLRDLKKWLRVFDEKQDRLDVARAISETSLVTFDLLEIISQWDLEEESKESISEDIELSEQQNTASSKKFRIALACLELLVPLTWPIVLDTQSSMSHYFHAPSLKKAHITYKRAILTHPKRRVFRAVIRLCLPALQAEPNKRSVRDEGILKLAVYFFRNVLQINVKDESTESEDIARSNEIKVMADQSVLDFLVMISSGIGESFKFQSLPAMECLYYLLYGIKIHQVLDIQSDFFPSSLSKPFQDLKDLLATEKSVRRNIQQHTSSRHNRFGTMLSVKTPDNDWLSVSGQPSLLSTASTLKNLDAAKSWRRPHRVDVKHRQQWDLHINLSEESRLLLQNFVNDFLDSAYNPLFIDLRKILERELGEISTTLLPEHQMQFLYLVAWFLESERARQVINLSKQPSGTSTESDYSSVAGTLNQNIFIIVINSMRTSYESKEWRIVYASMLCFKEILNVVNDMEKRGTEDMQDMADNIKSRLFYEESSLDLLSKIPRTAQARDISYLNLSIELTHIVLRILEKYATDKQTIYIRAKRQSQRRKQKKKEADAEDGIVPMEEENESDSEVERRKTSQNIRERKFSFEAFETKFITEETLDSYITYLSNYKELTATQIMYAIKFFHRIFAKRKFHYYFYRLDLMKLFNEMVGSDSPKVASTIDRATQRDIIKFVQYFVQKLIGALERTPSLFVEMLFQKMPHDVFYFENGFDKPVHTPKQRQIGRPFVFTNDEYTASIENKFAILVACLIDEDKIPMVEWAADALNRAYQKRAAWIEMAAADNGAETPSPPEEVITSSEKLITEALQKDKKLQLLLTISGCKFPIEGAYACVLPSEVSMISFQEAIKYIKRYLFQTVEFPDGKVASDFLHREQPPQKEIKKAKKAAENGEILSDDGNKSGGEFNDLDGFIVRGNEDGDEEDYLSDEEEPEHRHKRKHNSESSSRKRHKPSGEKSVNRLSRQQIEIEKALRQFKSSDYVHDSDDDLNPEELEKFFESERLLREKFNAAKIYEKEKASQVKLATKESVSVSQTEGEDSDSGSHSKQAEGEEDIPSDQQGTSEEDEDEVEGDEEDKEDKYYEVDETAPPGFGENTDSDGLSIEQSSSANTALSARYENMLGGGQKLPGRWSDDDEDD